jgi:hypothetical protein
MAKRPRRSKSDRESVEVLARLPQADSEVWQADIRRAPAWVRIAGVLQRPWMILVTSRTRDLVLAHEMPEGEPDIEMLWQNLATAMESPDVGQPQRPLRIEVGSELHQRELAGALERIGIRCVVRSELEHLEFVLDDLARHLQGGRNIPSLLDVPGMTRRQVARYYTAAAAFYRRRPWEMVPSDSPIRVECDKYQSGPWYGVVMGQSGMVFGLALHEGESALDELLRGAVDEREGMRRASAISLMFGDKFEIAVKDLDASDLEQWEVADAHAFPLVLRVNPGRALRAPLVWELELLEACLWAIPDFLAMPDVPEVCVKVPSVGEGFALRLGWPRADR